MGAFPACEVAPIVVAAGRVAAEDSSAIFRRVVIKESRVVEVERERGPEIVRVLHILLFNVAISGSDCRMTQTIFPDPSALVAEDFWGVLRVVLLDLLAAGGRRERDGRERTTHKQAAESGVKNAN